MSATYDLNHTDMAILPSQEQTGVFSLTWDDGSCLGICRRGSTREMQSSHAATAVDVAFDDPNLIADAGLVPVVASAEQVGLPGLVTEHVRITGADNSAGANPAAKVMSLLAGMVAGADSIADVDRLRHAGNRLVLGGTRAPSTLGTFLRAFTHGHVQQLNAVPRQTLIALAQRAPLLPGADEVVFVDLDSTHRQVYGYAKQGAAVGRLKGKKTLHPLIVTASTPISRPVVNQQVAGRLIVRRVKRLNPRAAPGQDGLFDTWRHHAVFVTSRFQMLQAEAQHRGHAIVEQVIADAAGSALAHLPSGSFQANAAWAVFWAIAHNLTRAAGVLASAFQRRARPADPPRPDHAGPILVEPVRVQNGRVLISERPGSGIEWDEALIRRLIREGAGVS